MKTVLCIAPHPDDESTGCGGTLLRHAAEGDAIHWLIATTMPEDAYTPERRRGRDSEIDAVANAYAFAAVHRLGLPAARLDTLPLADVVGAMGKVVGAVRPDVLYLPYRNDVHSDHAVVFDAGAACCKTFRYPSVRRVCVYETLSETEFGLRSDDPGFRPNLFVDVSAYLEAKIRAMRLYAGEMGSFPFPRSEECIRAQAALRGSQAGVLAAEAFMMLKEVR
jgi:LmbE family N-acetylglucosaminyl deacetylase